MPDAPVQLAAIINSFNRAALLREALPALVRVLQAFPAPAAIVVFDAGSTDGSREWIEQQAAGEPDIPIVLLRPQAGDDTSFSGGINAACAGALRQFPGLKWLFFYETDNWLATAAPLLAAIDLLENEPSLAAAGFTARKHDGRPSGYGCPFPTVPQFVLGPQAAHRLQLDRPKIQHPQTRGITRWWLCDVVYTSPLVVKRAAWEQAGGFDATVFPFSDSDLDWAWRLRRLGRLQAVIETRDVVHDNREQLSLWSTTRALNFHRARLALLQRHRGGTMTLAKPLLWLRHALETLAVLLLWSRLQDPRATLQKRRALLRSVFSDYKPTPARP